MKETFKKLIKSTLIVISISLLIAYAIKNLGGNFTSSFILAFTIQYILFSFIGNIINSYLKEKTTQKELDILEPLSTILNCAYCNHTNVMTFLPDESETSEFTCSKCEKKNSVRIQFVVARQTEMISLPVSSNGVSLIDKEDLDNNKI
jgi:hypothetical protein